MHFSTNQATAPLVAPSPYIQPLSPDIAGAAEFLTLLDPTAQTFHLRTLDDKKLRRRDLTKNLPATTLSSLTAGLTTLNRQEAGVFVVVNEGGHTADAITRVRAVFADTDGAPLEPLLILKPHIVVESSPGNYHVYWLVDGGFPLDKFPSVQNAIAGKYGTDKSVKDLPRIMRLPGFYHQKGAPFLVRILESNPDLPRYTLNHITEGLGLSLDATQSEHSSDWLESQAPKHIASLFASGEVLGKQPTHEAMAYTKENRELVLSAAHAAWPDGIPDRNSFVALGMPLASLVVINDWPETIVREILDDVSSKPTSANRDNNDAEWASYLAGTSAKHKSGDSFLGIGSLIKQAQDNGWTRPDSAAAKLSGLSRFALITLGSKVGIIDIEQARQASTLKPLNVYSRDDGGVLIQRLIAEINPQADSSREFKTWRCSPATRMYAGVELNPNGTTEGYLNLFRGLSIAPMQGEYPLILSFLKDIVCDGSNEYYNYLFGWMAHLVQKAGEKPGVSILLLGGQGVGKGTFATKIVGGLYAHHFLHLQSDTPLTGTFNESLESSLVVFADEAFFSGDRRGANILKAVETETRLHITAKFQPGRQITSYHRIIAASNNTHAAHVEEDDRRKFVLRLSESKKGDFAYWQALDSEIHDGGLSALAYDLLHHDLAGFQVRQKPNTNEHMRQKLASLDAVPMWWLDRLTEGRQRSMQSGWENWMSSECLHVDFVEWAKTTRQHARLPSLRDFVATLKYHCPSLTPAQEGPSHSRKRGFKFPSIEQCRAAFEQVCGGTIEWDRAQ